MTKEDLAIIARCIAVANNHPAPDDYVGAVVDAFEPTPVAPELMIPPPPPFDAVADGATPYTA